MKTNSNLGMRAVVGITSIALTVSGGSVLANNVPTTSASVVTTQVLTVPQVQPIQHSNSAMSITSSPVQNPVATSAVVAPGPSVEATIAQPTTVIEASPISASKAEELRSTRNKMELDTEQKIVEKLEQSRLDDEQKRLDKLFGNKKPDESATPTQPAPAALVPVPAAVVVPAVVAAPVAPMVAPVEKKEELDPEELKSDIAAQVREDLKAEADAAKAQEPKNRSYLGGLVGMVDYGDLDYVESKGSIGLTVGTIFPSNFAVDVSLVFSNHYVNETSWVYREMDQYNVGLTGRYLIMRDKVQPSVGGVLNYVRRDYSDPRTVTGYNLYPYSVDSDALDAGFVAAIDFQVSDQLMLGAEWRLMRNISYRYADEDALNTAAVSNSTFSDSALENSNYNMLNFVMKFAF